jgi:hypothetical protein
MKCPIYGLDISQDSNSKLRLKVHKWITSYLESFENEDGDWDEELWWSETRANHPLDSLFSPGDWDANISLEESYLGRIFDFHFHIDEISKWFYELQTPKNIADEMGLCSFEVREAYQYIDGYGSKTSVTSFHRNNELGDLEYELNENLIIYATLFAVAGSTVFYKFFDQFDYEDGFIFRSMIGTVNGSQIPIKNVAKLNKITTSEASDAFFRVERQYLLHVEDLLSDYKEEGSRFLRENFSYRNEKISNLLFGQ